MEKGKPRASIGFTLRTLNALGLSFDLQDTVGGRLRQKKGLVKKHIDLVDQVLSRLQDKKS